jgi:hypothetical protein
MICEDDLHLIGDFYKMLHEVYKLNNVDMIKFEGLSVDEKNSFEYTTILENTSSPYFMRIINEGMGNGCYLSTKKHRYRNISVWKNTPNKHCDHSIVRLFNKYNIYI